MAAHAKSIWDAIERQRWIALSLAAAFFLAFLALRSTRDGGVPLKIYRPQLRLVLVEANRKKATFLREVGRALALRDVEVHAGRAEQLIPAGPRSAELQGWPADLVTLRAVERFEVSVGTAAQLVASRGTLALLIGERQARTLPDLLPKFAWLELEKIPGSRERVIAIGKNQEREESTR